MTNKQRSVLSNVASTIMGLLVAVASAWVNIEWEHFELNNKTMFKLFLSALVAIGGYMTSINMLNKPAKQ